VQKKKVTMPKIRKFRDLSRRQRNRRLLIQRKNENICISREHTVIHNTQNFICIECLSKNINLNTIELFSNISDIQIDVPDVQTDIQPENDIIQNMHDSVLTHNTVQREKRNLNEKLHLWAIEYNITQTSLTALLRILKDEGYNKLPSDSRTLLNTPKETNIRECGTGHYFHYGLQSALRDKLKHCKNINNVKNIEININIDGLYLVKCITLAIENSFSLVLITVIKNL